ncbi:MAG TPA: hypothetical protein PKY49_01960, partial [Anaerolineae bacterium]|nr:hypothetical protein [Anaerolineae bacterium]
MSSLAPFAASLLQIRILDKCRNGIPTRRFEAKQGAAYECKPRVSYVVIGGVNAACETVLPPRHLEWAELEDWLRTHLQPTDK